ncbi:nitroreductase family protein [Streptomyces sp. NBC_01508]|uniref:nitroreductase family protein n=1 Tax=Streptomyces sp. NBC_01508 TaxID=2903888 RepID=UPI00386B121E
MPFVAEADLERRLIDLVERRRAGLPAAGRTGDPAGQYGSPTAQLPYTEGLKPLEEVLRGRRSVREFAPRAVAARTLSDVLARAHLAQDRQWPRPRHGAAGLRTVVAAGRVAELSRGPHLWNPDSGFTPLTTSDPRSALLIEELADAYTPAPAHVMICGSPRDVDPAAYAGLLVRAGALGHAIWLAARTHGLDCSLWGGASNPVTRALRDTAPADRHLFMVAMGEAC